MVNQRTPNRVYLLAPTAEIAVTFKATTLRADCQAGMDRILRLLPYDDAVRARFADAPLDLRRRARLVAAFCVLACTGGWTLAGSHLFFFEIPAPLTLAPFLAGTVAVVLPLLLLRTRSVPLVGHLVAACWVVAVGWGMWLRGGLATPPVYAQVAVPFIALVLLDRRAGWIWGAVVLAELGVYAALLLRGVTLPDLMAERFRLPSNLVASSLFGTLVLAMGAAMEWLREEANAELAVALDKKSRAEREAGMLRADRLASVGQLVASLAHEINNPLSYLLGNLAWLQGELAPGEQAAALEDALDGAQRVKTIVQDLKTFSRSDDEQLVPVDLRAVVASSLRMAAGELRHRAEVQTELGDCPKVLGTTTRLGQVLINLVVNAAQAMPEVSGRPNLITVSLGTTARGEARLSVRDNGVGIPEEILARVTEPFFTTKPIGVGTGLGLSVCDNLVRKLGGVMAIESKAGAGTLVTITLPPAPPAAEVAGALLPAGPQGTALRILVVDDEQASLRALERSLRGHEVVCAGGGREALDLLARDTAFDLILCDLMMPELNGVDVAEALRRRTPRLEARLVLITAGAITERTRDFLTNSRLEVLPKPIDVDALLRLVQDTPRLRVA
jgi:signal transduction histidine kinase/CheY-like chemotaxis protein